MGFESEDQTPGSISSLAICDINAASKAGADYTWLRAVQPEVTVYIRLPKEARDAESAAFVGWFCGGRAYLFRRIDTKETNNKPKRHVNAVNLRISIWLIEAPDRSLWFLYDLQPRADPPSPDLLAAATIATNSVQPSRRGCGPSNQDGYLQLT